MRIVLPAIACLFFLPILPVNARSNTLPNRHVLVIGIDGLRSDALKAADAPIIKSLAASGTTSWDAFSGGILNTPSQQATVSGPSWSSIITGVWTDRHHVTDNTFNGYASLEYPHFFKRIREKYPDAFLSSIVEWDMVDKHLTGAVASSVNYRYLAIDCNTDDLKEHAISHLSSASPDVLFLYFDETDCAGHNYGYGPGSSNYLAAIAKVDKAVGEIIDAIKNRPDYKNEYWLFIITSDHGGTGNGHGGQSAEERSVPFIVNGKNIAAKSVSPGPGIAAVPSTVLAFLGLDIDPSWGWAEPPFGLQKEKPVVISYPENRNAEEGDTVFYSAAVWGNKPAYQWKFNDKNIPGATSSWLVLKNISPGQAGTYLLEVTDNAHTVITLPVNLKVTTQPSPAIGGQWDFFKASLAGTHGAPLRPVNSAVEKDLTFGTTQSFMIPGIQGENVHVMRFSPSTPDWPGLAFSPGLKPNGGGRFINRYTLIFDVYYPKISEDKWRALLQTNEGNNNDTDFCINPSNGMGINGSYHGLITGNRWYRIIIAVDLTIPVVVKYIDGVQAGKQSLPSGIDGRWSLGSTALFFADDNGENAEGFVSSIQIRNGCISDSEAAKLGGATADKIPLVQ